MATITHMHRLALILTLGALPLPLIAQIEGGPVIRREPRDFPALPAPLRSALESRHCQVPQTPGDSQLVNVLSAALRAPDARDWVALCERPLRTDILVFFGGEPSTVDSLPSSPGMTLLAASPAYIIQHLEWYGLDNGVSLEGKGDSLRTVILHEGLEEADSHCCSVVHYWTLKGWLEYPGAD